MILEFENRNGKRKEIGEPKTYEEAREMINNFLKEHKYKSYYTRVNDTEKDEIWFDVGSYTEFFYLKGITQEEKEKIFGKRYEK